MALVALIVGILALALSPLIVGGFVAFVAIFLGVISQGNQGRRGMALTAIIMGIVAILASGVAIFIWYVVLNVAPRFRGPGVASRGGPMVFAARTDLSNLTVALDTFELDIGRFPTDAEGLDSLVKSPAGLTTWKGPYIKRIPTDPWGHPYIYHEPGGVGAPSTGVLSAGPDGIEGTVDDIN
jgi:general secretion pathway protein G